MKLIRKTSVEGVYTFWCPGCQEMHQIHTITPNHLGAIWQFDGNFEKPTITPSVNVHDAQGENGCHFNITDGMIIFGGESRCHNLSGQSFPLTEMPTELKK